MATELPSQELPSPELPSGRNAPSPELTELPSVGVPTSSEEEDARPLLGGRMCTGEEAPERIREDESLLSRSRRVLWWRRMLRPGEISGSLGDLGTFLPDVVALSNNPLGAYPVPASLVFFSGFWSLASGCSYDMPMLLQPMHTVVAVSLTEGLTYAETVAAGVWLGAAFLFLGGTGLVSALKRAVPLPVVRGLQLGLGLKVVGAGISLGTKTRVWVDTSANLDGYLLGGLALLVALLSYGHRRLPASLPLFALGCVGMLYARPAVALGLHQPFAPPPALTMADAWAGLYRAALPQLPVTLLNAVVATAKLSEDLYPHRPASVRKLSLSIGLMDASSCWFGHFPSCHGCGGLAAQHLYGARTGSSMALIGLAKMLLALLVGPSLLPAFAAFPATVLGVLLGVSGIELAACCRDMRAKPDFAVMLVGAGCVLKLGTGIGFLAACATALAFRFTHPRPPPPSAAGSAQGQGGCH